MVEEEYINFDNIAKDYDFSRAISDNLLKLFLANFLEVTNANGSLKEVLEIGCGTGRISRIFAINNFNITGVDISKNMLEKALIKAREEKWSFKGVIADARDLPFPKNSFDISYAVHVLHLIRDWKKVIEEALRCSNNKFVDVNLNRSLFSTDMMTNYWKYMKDIGQSVGYDDKKIGAKNNGEIVAYMEEKDFNWVKKEFKTIATIKINTLVEIANSKSFSSQRFIPDNIHNQAMIYLKEHDYFLPMDKNEIQIEENGVFHYYYES